MSILMAILGIVVLTLLGFIFGFGLSFFSSLFKVEDDGSLKNRIFEVLPKLNCGGCGYPGCLAYAAAIEEKGESISLCAPGSDEVIDAISDITNRKSDGKSVKKIARVFCAGDDLSTKKDFELDIGNDCFTVYAIRNGDRLCKFACVARGNCAKVCPVNAISISSIGRVIVDENLCISCEKCTKVCPTNVIKMVPINGGFYVACSSHDKGAVVRKNCKKGCIGCDICTKFLKDDNRLVMDNDLAVVKYNNKNNLTETAAKCPVKVITPIL